MFCLRSWIPILFFLWVTDAAPVYLLLFLTATYLLNRPCVYCSLLLGILVVVLFDFHTSWFTPSYLLAEPFAQGVNGANATLAQSVSEMASAVIDGVNSSVGAVMKNASEEVKRRIGEGEAGRSASMGLSEWVRNVVLRKEWRVPCLDVYVRI